MKIIYIYNFTNTSLIIKKEMTCLITLISTASSFPFCHYKLKQLPKLETFFVPPHTK